MTAIDMARRAYSNQAAPTRTHRGVEYDALSRVTRALGAADACGDFPRLARALHENRRLWTVLAASVADRDNRLPEPLRARIFWLAEFTDRHSRQVLQGRAKVTPLIEVNTAVMRGLAGGQGE